MDAVESEDRLPAPGVKFVQEPSNELSVDHDGALIDRPEAISPCRKPAGLPVLPTDWNAAQDELLRLGRPVERVWAIHEEVEHHRKDCGRCSPTASISTKRSTMADVSGSWRPWPPTWRRQTSPMPMP